MKNKTSKITINNIIISMENKKHKINNLKIFVTNKKIFF